ncbi:two-component regulator propeller domain-containing protein [Edaphobacter modestus]|nr:two-component regulator propeller domain-containing protein [Edaphobacter modestus]
MPSTSITALLGARDGSLWIGTDAGLVHRVNQHLITYLKGEGYISSILQDVNGEIWIARDRSGDNTQPLCKVIGIGVHCYGNEDGVPAFLAGPLVQDASSNLWIGGDTTLLRWRPGSSNAYRPKALKSNAGVDGVEALSVAADGSLWVGMALSGSGRGLQHLVDGGLKSFVAPKLNGETIEVTELLEDHEKNLWVGTSNRVSTEFTVLTSIIIERQTVYRVTSYSSFTKIVKATSGWLRRKASIASVTFG